MKRETFRPAQAQQVAAAFAKHQVDYMFIGKSGAILLGYPGTTQDVHVFPRKDAENGGRIVAALMELGFAIDTRLEADIIRGKDFVQIKNGPFDIDLVFAPDGIENYDEAKARIDMTSGFPVATSATSLRVREPRNGPGTRSSFLSSRRFAKCTKRNSRSERLEFNY